MLVATLTVTMAMAQSMTLVWKEKRFPRPTTESRCKLSTGACSPAKLRDAWQMRDRKQAMRPRRSIGLLDLLLM